MFRFPIGGLVGNLTMMITHQLWRRRIAAAAVVAEDLTRHRCRRGFGRLIFSVLVSLLFCVFVLQRRVGAREKKCIVISSAIE